MRSQVNEKNELTVQPLSKIDAEVELIIQDEEQRLRSHIWF